MSFFYGGAACLRRYRCKFRCRGCSTGLSVDKIGLKVHSRIILIDGLSDLVSKDIIPYRRETYSDSWPSSNI